MNKLLAVLLDAPIATIELVLARLRRRKIDTGAFADGGIASAGLNIPPDKWAKVRRAGRAVSIVARFAPFRSNCLDQAIAVQHWLARHDIPSVIRFGARREGAELDAHAWLSVDGQTIIGERQAHYSEFRLSSSERE